jgi:hypothetical protein
MAKVLLPAAIRISGLANNRHAQAKTNRHKSLVRAVTKGKEDPHAVIKRLVAISTLTKRTAPRASRIYKADAKWVHAKYSKFFGNR